MKFALLTLVFALALLAPASLAYEDEADTEFFDDVDDAPLDDAIEEDNEEVEKTSDPCSPRPYTDIKTLGGKEISQVIVSLMTDQGCKRVLEGGTSDDYTLAHGCAHCRTKDGSFYCVGSPLMRSMKCDVVLGPDCRMHTVDKSDPKKACE